MNPPDDSLKVTRVAQNLRQQVVELLRGAILEYRFKPGDRLIERELCELTGVSRTSVREALRHLESEGLVVNLPNKGPTVAVVTAQDALELYEVRGALEALAGRLFATRKDAALIAQLQAALATLEARFAERDRRGIETATAALYEVLLTGCGNGIVLSLTRSLHARAVLLRATSMAQPGRWPVSLAEMQRIVAAISSGDPEAADLACRHHVEQAKVAALEMLRSAEPRQDERGR